MKYILRKQCIVYRGNPIMFLQHTGTPTSSLIAHLLQTKVCMSKHVLLFWSWTLPQESACRGGGEPTDTTPVRAQLRPTPGWSPRLHGPRVEAFWGLYCVVTPSLSTLLPCQSLFPDRLTKIAYPMGLSISHALCKTNEPWYILHF